MTNKNDSDVIIVGSGIIGICCGLWLQRRGVNRVLLIDHADPGTGASFGNAGAIATFSVSPVATAGVLRSLPGMLIKAESPLAIRWPYLPKALPWLTRFLLSARASRVEHASRALASLQHEVLASYKPLLEESGASRFIRRDGVLYVYGSRQSLRDAESGLSRQQRRGVDFERLDVSAVHALEPTLARIYAGGVLYKGGVHISDPFRFTTTLFDYFIAQGGDYVSDHISHIRSAQDNEVYAAGQNRSYKSRKIVVAAGAWSKALCASIGDHIPLDTERGYHVMFPQGRNALGRPVCWADVGYYLTPMDDGLRVAGTVEIAGLSAPPNQRRLQMLKKGALRLLPELGASGEEWLGFRPSVPDSLPVIGRSARAPSVLYAFGHGHLGMTLAGVTGRLIADIVQSETPRVDLEPFRPDRFALLSYARVAPKSDVRHTGS